jgi:flagellar biosynthesis/type III secretory pathway protein FliH
MKETKKVLCLVVLTVTLISAVSAIAEHSKAETVERMEMPELQSADNGNASAIEAHQFSELPGEVTQSTRTPMGQIVPTPSVASYTDSTYDEGFKAGLEAGHKEGFEAGLKEGFDAGYEAAYQDIIQMLTQKQEEVKTNIEWFRNVWWSHQGSQAVFRYATGDMPVQ